MATNERSERQAAAEAEKRRKTQEALKALSATPAELAEQEQELQAERRAAGHPDPLPAALTLTEQRVDAIVDLMLSGQWVQQQSERQLNRTWGLSVTRIRNLAAEASRTIRRYMREDEGARQDALNEALISFDRIARKAEGIGTPNGLRVAKDTRVDKLTFMGLKPATRIAIRKDEMANWSDDELAHFVETGERPKDKE
jgi:hypothetical protein